MTTLISACTTELHPDSAREILLIPAGNFQAIDGRPGILKNARIDSWRMDAVAADACIKAFAATSRDLVIDYEHQSVNAKENGQPAPAAGWIHGLHWQEGKGLSAQVTWTAKAAAMIKAGEYKYISPVFSFDANTGHVHALHNAGLTNNPALPGLGEVVASMVRPNTTQIQDRKEQPLINESILTALGLKADADETAILSAITELKKKSEETDQSAVAVSQVAAKADASPNPATHVSLDVVTAMQKEIATLKAKHLQGEVDSLVAQGLRDGRLNTAMEKWARDLGATDVATLKSYLDQIKPIAALTAMQTGGKAPEGVTEGAVLDDSEKAVCTAMGVAPKDFVAAKAMMSQEGGE